jgi:hypothetical protein
VICLFTLFSLLLALSPSQAFAETTQELLDTWANALRMIDVKLNRVRIEQKDVDSRDRDNQAAVDMIKKSERRLLDEAAQYEEASRKLESEGRDYNGQCHGTTTDMGFKARCDAWLSRLEATKSQLNGEYRELKDRERAALDLRNRFGAEMEKWAERKKRNNFDQVKFPAMRSWVADTYIQCLELASNGVSLEVLKFRCGTIQFDGEDIHLSNPGIAPSGTPFFGLGGRQ